MITLWIIELNLKRTKLIQNNKIVHFFIRNFDNISYFSHMNINQPDVRNQIKCYYLAPFNHFELRSRHSAIEIGWIWVYTVVVIHLNHIERWSGEGRRV